MADDEELAANLAKAKKESLATSAAQAERLKREQHEVKKAKAASLADLKAQRQYDEVLGAKLDEHRDASMGGGARPAHRSPSQQQRQRAEDAAVQATLQAAAASDRAEQAEARLKEVAEAGRALRAQLQAEVDAGLAVRAQLQAESAARHALQVQLEGVEGGAAEREAVLQAQLATAAASAAAAAADAAAALGAASAQAAQRETELLARLAALETQARDAVEQARVAEGKVAVMHTTPAALLQELKDVRQELKVQAELKAAELKAQAERERELAVKLGVLEAERARQDRELGAQCEKGSSALQRVGVLESQLAAAAARVVALEAELRAAVLRAAAGESSAAAAAASAAASSRAQAQALQPQPSLLLLQQLEYTLRQVQSDLNAERQARQQATSALDAARRESAGAAAAAASASASASASAPASAAAEPGALKASAAEALEEPQSPSLAAVSIEESSLAVLPADAPLLSGIQAVLEREDAGWKMWASLGRCFVKLYSLHRLPRSVKEMKVYAAQLRQEAVMQAAAARKTPHVVRVLGWTEHGAAPSPAPSGSRAPLQWVVGVVQEACSLTLPAETPLAAAGGGASASASAASCTISNLSKLLTHRVLPFGVRLGLARHVAHGLAACALLRLRHRDVKPENVMLCEVSSAQGGAAGAGAGAADMPHAPPLVHLEGLQLVAKLGDFGSASQITRDGRTRQGLETASDYTLEFAAPEYLLQKLAREEEREKGDAKLLRKVGSSGALSDEQAAARHFYDQQDLPRTMEVLPSVDVFSFGVLLWELVALGGGLDAAGSGRQSALQWWLEWWEKRSERSGQLFAPELQDKDVAGALLEGVRLPPLAHRLAELRVPPELAQRYQELLDECCALLPMKRPVIGRVLERLHDLMALLGAQESQ